MRFGNISAPTIWTPADRVIEKILSAIRAVVPFPHTGHLRTGLTSRPLRFIRVHDCLIAYAPDEKPLWVIAVMRGHATRASWPRSCEAGKIDNLCKEGKADEVDKAALG